MALAALAAAANIVVSANCSLGGGLYRAPFLFSAKGNFSLPILFTEKWKAVMRNVS